MIGVHLITMRMRGYRACMLGLILLGAGLDYSERAHRSVKNFGP